MTLLQYEYMDREQRDLYDSAIREAIIHLIGRGYRDPFGRPAEVHLAIEFFGAREGDEPAQSIDDLEYMGTL